MKKYQAPKIEIDEIEVADIVLASGLGGNETPGVSGGGRPRDIADITVGGTIEGTTGGKITIGGGSIGGFSTGDLFGNR